MTAAVSVIIPVHNGEAYLARAIDSVLGQTPTPSEVIVIDDGSTDATPEVIAGYGARIIARSQPNHGAGGALNHGTRVATGEFLAFLDADDLWLPDKTAAQLAAFRAAPELEAVFGHVRQFLSDDLSPDVARRRICPEEPQPGVAKQTMMIRRGAFDRVGAFDETLRHVDFIDWYARAIERGLRTHMLPQVVALRRIHADNWGIRRRAGQRAENLIAIKRALDRRRGR